jgi:hypothetical protein
MTCISRRTGWARRRALTAGEPYVASVQAVNEPVSDLSSELGQYNLPYVSVDNVSQIFVP